MDLEKYDFESALEQGFKTLFDSNGLALRVADDVDEGELPDECIRLEINTGGPNSDEHLNAEGAYDNYTGTIDIEIKSKRVVNDEKSTYGAIRNRHNQLVAMVRKTLEEIDATVLSTNWPGALSPTKIKPTSTDRENDNLSKMTTLTYELQFRIA